MVICLLFLKITQPEYQSEATLKYNSNDQSQVTDMSQALFPDFMKDQQYLAEIYTLKSVSLISKALDTMGHHFAFEAREGLRRSEEHTSELQSLMRISYAVFCLKKKQQTRTYRNKDSPSKNHKHK